MRILIFTLIVGMCIVSRAQINYSDSKWVNDTIHFNYRNVFLTLPEKSVEFATEYILKGEGKGICYPLKVSFNNDGIGCLEMLMIDQIVNTSYDRIILNADFDLELWNTFNMDHMGSRCFLKEGKYSRIDVLRSGIIVYYENLSPEMSEIANKIIKSIGTRTSESMEGTTSRKRRVQIIE